MASVRSTLLVVLFVGLLAIPAMGGADGEERELWDAARKGDAERVQALIEAGVDVNAKTQYGATALSYACDRGHLEVVKILFEHNADPNVKDTFYSATPLSWAMMGKHQEIVELLISNGAEELDSALQMAIGRRDESLVKLLVETGRLSDRGVLAGLQAARPQKLTEIIELLESLEVDPASVVVVAPNILSRYSGTYAGDGVRYRVQVAGQQLAITMPNGQRVLYQPLSDVQFESLSAKLTFTVEEEKATALSVQIGSSEFRLKRVVDADATASPDSSITASDIVEREGAYRDDLKISSPNWPGFRGTGARGVAEGQNGPRTWDVPNNVNVLWKAEIAGIGLSCPVVYGDRVFVTTAISTEDKAGLKIGLYGDVDSVDDSSEHEFVVICFDKNSGEEVWRRTSHVGPPQVKRHLKSSHANPTPVTDGRFIVVSFGSEGIYCYDMEGNLAWSRELGFLDSGWFYDASYQWGFGSSPIIHGDRVILQCDIQEGSFITALDLFSGQEVWRTSRDEIPTWATPTVCPTPQGDIIVTNGTRAARAYDADTGEERWWFGGHSEIAVPTPFMAHDLVFVTSGYRPIQPIFAVHPTARGDLKPKPVEEATDDTPDETGDESNEVESTPTEDVDSATQESVDEQAGIEWELGRGGPYLPTPIVYGDFLYVCTNRGIVSCYDARTGGQVYRERLQVDGATSFVGSLVASDGLVYLPSEEGIVVTLKAGPKFEVVAANHLGEYLLTTPAISEGIMFFRGAKHLIAIRQNSAPRP